MDFLSPGAVISITAQLPGIQITMPAGIRQKGIAGDNSRGMPHIFRYPDLQSIAGTPALISGFVLLPAPAASTDVQITYVFIGRSGK